MLDLEELKLRINPKYAHIEGTESFERRLCVEEIESLRKQLEEANSFIKQLADHCEEVEKQLLECRQERDVLTKSYVTELDKVSNRNYELRHELEATKLDAERLDFIAHEYIDIQAFEMPTGAGDADIGWRCLQWHCGEKNPRVVSEVHRDNLREAIDAARKEPTC